MPTGVIGSASTNSNLYGSISYNGWTFYPPFFRSELEMLPEESLDGRTTLCNTYRLTVRAIVTDDPGGLQAFMASNNSITNHQTNLTTDQYNARSNIQGLRSKLSKNGARLTIVGLGFDIDINNGEADSIFDVRFGPKTKSLKLKQIGGGVVWQVDWVVEFSIPECFSTNGEGHPGHTAGSANAADDSYINFPYDQQGDLEGLSFNVAYAISVAGLTQRTISGSVTLVINRASATGDGAWNEIVETADSLRERIAPTLPLGFKRVSQQFVTSPDNRTLQFLIVDEELPGENRYPPGIIDLVIDHTVSSDVVIMSTAPQLMCSLDGYLECVKGASIRDAFEKVILIIQTRLDTARAFAAGRADLQGGNAVFVMGFSVTESMYGPRRVSFSVQYLVMNLKGTAAFAGVINRTGLFLPSLLYTQEEWGLSFNFDNTKAWTSRGIAQMEHTPDAAPIVGPCDNTESSALSDLTYPTPIQTGGGSLLTQCPPVGKDYLLWDVDVELDSDNGTVIHTPMAPSPCEDRVYKSEGEIPEEDMNRWTYIDGGGFLVKCDGNSEADVKPRASFTKGGPVTTIRIRIKAVRISRPPEGPKFSTNQLKDLYDSGKLVPGPGKPSTRNKNLGKIGDCPMFAMLANMEFTLLTTDPDEIQTIVQALTQAALGTPADPGGEKLGGEGSTSGEESEESENPNG